MYPDYNRCDQRCWNGQEYSYNTFCQRAGQFAITNCRGQGRDVRSAGGSPARFASKRYFMDRKPSLPPRLQDLAQGVEFTPHQAVRWASRMSPENALAIGEVDHPFQ